MKRGRGSFEESVGQRGQRRVLSRVSEPSLSVVSRSRVGQSSMLTVGSLCFKGRRDVEKLGPSFENRKRRCLASPPVSSKRVSYSVYTVGTIEGRKRSEQGPRTDEAARLKVARANQMLFLPSMFRVGTR